MNKGKSDFDAAILNEKLVDAMTPGYQAEFDPDEADFLGAFEEDALEEQDAIDSSIDVIEPALSAPTQKD